MRTILVCQGTGCTSSKSPKIMENFQKIIKEKGLQNVEVKRTGCFGLKRTQQSSYGKIEIS